jgi:FkbM family methyltransferase
MTKKPLDFLLETHGLRLAATARVLLNKATYVFARTLAPAPADGWLRSTWHWYRFPFSLRNHVLWNPHLQCWFRPEDESAIECMLHLPSYEPAVWVSPQAGDVFVDIGAYIGWYTIQAARAVAPSGQVFALEPDPANRKQLERNLALNQLHNVLVMPFAAWSRTCTIGWQHAEQPVWHRVQDSCDGPTQQAMSIDDLTQRLGLERLDWIKMDIEGAEVRALEGATRTLTAFRPKLFIEIHETKQAVQDLLTGLGFKVDRELYDHPDDRHGWILARSAG